MCERETVFVCVRKESEREGERDSEKERAREQVSVCLDEQMDKLVHRKTEGWID